MDIADKLLTSKVGHLKKAETAKAADTQDKVESGRFTQKKPT